MKRVQFTGCWCCVVLLSFLVAINFAAGQGLPLIPGFDPEALDKRLARQIKDRDMVGLSVAIMVDGKLAFAKSYGSRSLKEKHSMETNTMLAIGSVTKQFTCAAVLLLAEEGKLSIHDTVAKYFPDLTQADRVTLLDLMGHTSGYPDYYPLDYVDARMKQAVASDEIIARYCKGKLDFEPNTQWSYSNTGYIILARVVEKLSGQLFGTFLEQRILKPVDLRNTAYEPSPGDARLGRGYTSFALSPAEAVAPEAHGWAGAAGAVYSTPSDLVKWDLALMQGKILKPESFKIMTTPRQLKNGKLTDYGCGLSISTRARRTVYSHGGAVSGFTSWNAMIPSLNAAVVLICNKDSGLDILPNEVLSMLLRDKSRIPNVNGPDAADAAKAVFAQLQKGKVDRSGFTDDFNEYLTPEKLAGAVKTLKRYGKIEKSAVVSAHERGGMEVTVTRLTFHSGVLKALMYRSPDGKIAQFFVDRDNP